MSISFGWGRDGLNYDNESIVSLGTATLACLNNLTVTASCVNYNDDEDEDDISNASVTGNGTNTHLLNSDNPEELGLSNGSSPGYIGLSNARNL